MARARECQCNIRHADKFKFKPVGADRHAEVVVGSNVKIGRDPGEACHLEKEWFWVEITSLKPLQGKVNNDLVAGHGFDYGDLIDVSMEEIVDVYVDE